MEIETKNHSKKKLLILYNKLFHYRIPIFNILAQKYDLTVVYSFKSNEEDIFQCNFKTKFIPIIQVWKFVFHKANILKLCSDYDVVIAYGQSTWLNYSLLSLKKDRKFKLLFWSIGAPASYNRTYGDAGNLYYAFNDFFHHKADGLIFYSDTPIEMHQKRGYPKQKMFVANNTVKVLKQNFNPEIKNAILFIGTLYLEKGLNILLDSYLAAYKENIDIPELNIVGGGEKYNDILEWIQHYNLKEKIHLLGPIYDEKTKAEIFSKSIASISPLQAGLSVLESMGYGVPYITMKNSITGGESFNIKNHVNGLILNDTCEFKKIILDISKDKMKYIQFGLNAYNHYWENRNPEDMANSISYAIEQTS